MVKDTCQCAYCERMEDLKDAVLEWWEEEKDRTICGPMYEYDRYEETPKFVKIAQEAGEWING